MMKTADATQGPSVSSSPGRCAFGLRGTSHQHNTHIRERREICYPWHPWHGRKVSPDVQQKILRLLTQLLRQHCARPRAAGQAEEGRDE
jgi:hypothetical protein